MNKRFIVGIISVMITGSAIAQTYGDIYEKSIPDAKKIDYPFLREADVVWSKRYYRVVDLREKMNHPLYYPTDTTIKDGRKSFVNILFDEINNGNVTAYDIMDFKIPTTFDDVEKKLGAVMKTTAITINELGDTKDSTYRSDPKREEVKQLRLYEEWYFDKKLSKLDVRIIAVIPYYMGFNEDLQRDENSPVCWIWFDDIRDILAKYEVFSPNNDAQRISFDDLFMQRTFSSYIQAESNVYNDRNISSYLVGKPALYEAERIKTELFNFEHDLWEY
jgi:gliding motility associated protien GldN